MKNKYTFEEAFLQCLDDGVHPGPTEINKRTGKIGRLNTLSGNQSRLRLELMVKHRIPYLRDGAYGLKGEVPHDIYDEPQYKEKPMKLGNPLGYGY